MCDQLYEEKSWTGVSFTSTHLMCQWDAVWIGTRVGGAGRWGRQVALGEVGGEEAEWLVLVGRQGGAVALEVAWDAATGGA